MKQQKSKKARHAQHLKDLEDMREAKVTAAHFETEVVRALVIQFAELVRRVYAVEERVGIKNEGAD